jgi:hypothetical protein
MHGSPREAGGNLKEGVFTPTYLCELWRGDWSKQVAGILPLRCENPTFTGARAC